MTHLVRAMIVIGIGNPDRGDDRVGREVARRLSALFTGTVDVVELEGDATALLARLESASTAFLVDACASGAPPGTILRIDANEATPRPIRFGMSSHGLGLAEALELARTLGRLPSHCIIYAVEAEAFDVGTPMSASVANAVEGVVARLYAEIKSHICTEDMT